MRRVCHRPHRAGAAAAEQDRRGLGLSPGVRGEKHPHPPGKSHLCHGSRGGGKNFSTNFDTNFYPLHLPPAAPSGRAPRVCFGVSRPGWQAPSGPCDAVGKAGRHRDHPLRGQPHTAKGPGGGQPHPGGPGGANTQHQPHRPGAYCVSRGSFGECGRAAAEPCGDGKPGHLGGRKRSDHRKARHQAVPGCPGAILNGVPPGGISG